jgi:ribosomal protein L37AE/L43A
LRETYPVAPPPDLTLDVILYGLLVLGSFGFLWFYYDRRDRALYDAQRRKITFHCIRCDHLYTEKAGTGVAPCPKCGHPNTRLKF